MQDGFSLTLGISGGVAVEELATRSLRGRFRAFRYLLGDSAHEMFHVQCRDNHP